MSNFLEIELVSMQLKDNLKTMDDAHIQKPLCIWQLFTIKILKTFFPMNTLLKMLKSQKYQEKVSIYNNKIF